MPSIENNPSQIDEDEAIKLSPYHSMNVFMML
jgi:hypothetical protein